MVKLDDFNEASRLAFAHMKPGVLTNHVMTADEYRADIAHGALFAHTWAGGVLFLRKRATCHMLSYYLNDLNILPECDLPGDTFLEIAYKPSEVENAGHAVDFWEQAGLWTVLERIRLTRPAAVADVQNCVQADNRPNVNIATLQDINACYKLMQASFDPITGHIPEYYEIEDSIAAGCILCLRDLQHMVCGLLRWVPRAASIEIRQLALREDVRGQGLARYLLDAYIEKWGNSKNTVWVRDGYIPALKSYTAAGFEPDGRRSIVMCL